MNNINKAVLILSVLSVLTVWAGSALQTVAEAGYNKGFDDGFQSGMVSGNLQGRVEAREEAFPFDEQGCEGGDPYPEEWEDDCGTEQ